MNITTDIQLESQLAITVNVDYEKCNGDRWTPPIDEMSINSIKSSKGRRVSIEAVARHEGRPVWWIEETITEQITEYSQLKRDTQ